MAAITSAVTVLSPMSEGVSGVAAWRIYPRNSAACRHRSQRGHPTGTEREFLRQGPLWFTSFFRSPAHGGESGIPRIRFATSHPKDLIPATITAMAEIPAVMPALHLAVQSGSDRILAAMNRRYTADKYLSLINQVRESLGDCSFSTDIIVGFPGETEDDFQQTMELCRKVNYTSAFTFIYSKREGTPAAKIVDTTPHEVIQRRFDELHDLIQESALQNNLKRVGTVQQILVEGVSKRDENILMGRNPGNQVVHAPIPSGMDISSLIGGFVDVRIDNARTWYLSGEVVDPQGPIA